MEKTMKYGYAILIGLFVIIGGLIGFVINKAESREIKVEVKNNKIIVMNNTYPVNDIEKVELLKEVNLFKGAGLNTSKINKGKYKVNNDDFESIVYIHRNVSPFIKLTTKDTVIVFNKDDSSKTKDIYNQISEVIKENKK